MSNSSARQMAEEPAGFSGTFNGSAREEKVVHAEPVSGVVVREVVEADAILPKEAAMVLASSGVGPDMAVTLQKSFTVFFSEAASLNRQAFAIRVTDPNDTKSMKRAKEMRLKMRAVRVDGDKARKALKEESLRLGRAIDSMGNCLKSITEPAEAYLQEQETFGERHFAAQREKLAAERSVKVQPYLDVFAQCAGGMDLTAMEEPAFELFLNGLKLQHEKKIEDARRADEEAKATAERERLARESQERELARMREEIRQREAKAAEDKRIADAEAARLRKLAEDAQRETERVQREAEAQRQEAARSEALRLAQIEAERVRVANESAAQQRAQEAAARAAANAPDREKVLAFARAVAGLDVPVFTSYAGQAFRPLLVSQIAKFGQWLVSVADSQFK